MYESPLTTILLEEVYIMKALNTQAAKNTVITPSSYTVNISDGMKNKPIEDSTRKSESALFAILVLA